MCSSTAFFYYKDNIRVGRQLVPVYFARCLRHQIKVDGFYDTLSRQAYEDALNEHSVRVIMEL